MLPTFVRCEIAQSCPTKGPRQVYWAIFSTKPSFSNQQSLPLLVIGPFASYKEAENAAILQADSRQWDIVWY